MPKLSLESLGRLVREKRGEAGLRETAKVIEISPATLMRIEQGRTPDIETFGKVCQWLKIDPSDFIGGGKRKEDVVGGKVRTEMSVHLRANKNPDPNTIKALSEMILLVAEMQPTEELQ
jgi:transcriptional regulator with XRE-family HTH domain